MNVDAADVTVKITTMDDLPTDALCTEKKIKSKLARRGFTVECHCSRLWGGKHWVKTPCCGEGKRGVFSGDLTQCPKCNQWYRIFISPEETKWVSCGK